MIRTELYDKTKHDKHLKRWLKVRMGDDSAMDDLPTIGFVAFCDDTPVAAAFCRDCESMAMLEGLVSNPDAPSAKRHLGIEEVVISVIKYARNMGKRKLLAYSVDEGTLKRSVSHGFQKIPHQLIGLNLEE